MLHAERRLAYEVAVPLIRHVSIALRLFKHFSVRFARKLPRAVVAIRNALKQVIHPQQIHDSLAMVDISISEEPHADFRIVDAQQQLAQVGIATQNVLERECIIDSTIVLQWVDLVMPYEALYGKAVLLVILLMQVPCIFLRERQVFLEVFV